MVTAVRKTGGHALLKKYGKKYFVELGRKSWANRPKTKKEKKVVK